MEFLVRGARDYGEAGVMLSFEESRQNILENMASLGFGLPALIEAGQILIEPCLIQPAEMVQAGSFDLDGSLPAAGAGRGADRRSAGGD